MKRRWIFPLSVTFLMLGILISTQLQTQNRLTSDLSQQTTSELAIMVKNLSEKRQALLLAIDELEKSITAYKASYVDNSELINQLGDDITRTQMSIGAIAVEGPGISVTITKNSGLMYYDLLDIINELWAARAEAIAVNETRITSGSSFFYADVSGESYLTLDKEILRYPLVINAIGDADTLDKGLSMPGGILDMLASFGIKPTITHNDLLKLPAAGKLPELRSAQVVK